MHTTLIAAIAVLLFALGACGPRQFGSSSGRGDAPPDLGYEDGDGSPDDVDRGNVIVSGDDDEAWDDVEIGDSEEWSERDGEE